MSLNLHSWTLQRDSLSWLGPALLSLLQPACWITLYDFTPASGLFASVLPVLHLAYLLAVPFPTRKCSPRYSMIEEPCGACGVLSLGWGVSFGKTVKHLLEGCRAGLAGAPDEARKTYIFFLSPLPFLSPSFSSLTTAKWFSIFVPVPFSLWRHSPILPHSHLPEG